MLGTSNATDLGGQANDLIGSSNYGLGRLSPSPGWLFPVLVWRDHTGR